MRRPRADTVTLRPGIESRTDSGASARLDVEPSIPNRSSAPETIGRYEIITPIASGGMGTVYAGRLVGMAGFERLVSIKVIHPHLAAETAFIEMFLDEARLAARIHHPYVAEIYEVGEDHGVYYMVGELVLGQDLHRLVETADKQGFTIPRAVLASMLADVAKGLHEAHELKDEDDMPSHLVHRDISTSNILISYKGYVKLIDFGVAWARRRLTHTRNGAQKGKIGYMPKEQLLGQPVDRRADIFALGVVLYTAAVGTHPFPYDNEGEQVAKMLKGEFHSPRMIDPDIEPELEAIILKAMATEPEDRYRTASEMEKDLLAFVSETATGDTKKQLADLMHTLFQNEIREQNARIKNHRKRATGLGMVSPHTVSARVTEKSAIRSRHTEVLSNPDGKVIETTDIQAYGTKGKLAVATFPIVVILAGFLLYFASNNDGEASSTKSPVSARPTGEKGLKAAVPKKPEAVSIRFNGLQPGSVVYLNEQRTNVPIQLEPTVTPMSVRVETPGYEDFKAVLTPDSDQTLQVTQKQLAVNRKGIKSKQTKRRRPKRHRKQKMPAPPEQEERLKGALVDPTVNPYQ